MVLAGISSPDFSTTEIAAPSFTRISATSASVRISAPAAFAADDIACVIAPIPPAAKCAEPAGCESPAPRISRTSALPADQGPRNVPKMPRAATVPRSRSVSKYSATRSATAIGPQRNRRYKSFLPSFRRARPVCSMPHRSVRLGLSMSGGVSFSASAITLPILRSDSCSSGYFAASFWENFAISAADFCVSL